MFCTKCGKSIPDGENSCPSCGAQVSRRILTRMSTSAPDISVPNTASVNIPAEEIFKPNIPTPKSSAMSPTLIVALCVIAVIAGLFVLHDRQDVKAAPSAQAQTNSIGGDEAAGTPIQDYATATPTTPTIGLDSSETEPNSSAEPAPVALSGTWLSSNKDTSFLLLLYPNLTCEYHIYACALDEYGYFEGTDICWIFSGTYSVLEQEGVSSTFDVNLRDDADGLDYTSVWTLQVNSSEEAILYSRGQDILGAESSGRYYYTAERSDKNFYHITASRWHIPSADADMPIGQYYGVLGASFYVPDGFYLEPSLSGGYTPHVYYFYNPSIDMSIVIKEAYLSNYLPAEYQNDPASWFKAAYDQDCVQRNVTYSRFSSTFNVVSGYSGDYIFYNKRMYATTSLHEIDFLYPSALADEGERILLNFLDSWSA